MNLDDNVLASVTYIKPTNGGNTEIKRKEETEKSRAIAAERFAYCFRSVE
jgi:hypothetical protein